MEDKKRKGKVDVDLSNDSDSKFIVDPDLIAKSYLPFKQFRSDSSSMPQKRKPSQGSLAWFMLRHGPLVPKPNPQPSSSSTSDHSIILPSAVVPLDFDLATEVHAFAMNYENIAFTHPGYELSPEPNHETYSEDTLQSHLKNYLWTDIDRAFKAAPNLPFRIFGVINRAGEDASIRRWSLNTALEKAPKIGIIELKTPSALPAQSLKKLSTRQPLAGTTNEKKILSQLLKYFKNANVTWGALTNGVSTVFIRYEPVTKVFAMSKIISHNDPSIIGYYCYFARLADVQQLDHPRPSLSIPAVKGSTSKDATGGKFKIFTRSSAGQKRKKTAVPKNADGTSIQISLDLVLVSYGEFAQVNTGKWLRRTGDVPIIAKLSYGDRESNNQLKEEIDNYESLNDLWGSVLPQIYGMGEIIEDGQASGTYCIAMEHLEKVENWKDPKRKVEAKQLLRQLHRRGFVHDDVSLNNLRWRSNPGEMVIIDLGLSHRGTAEEMEDELAEVDLLET